MPTLQVVITGTSRGLGRALAVAFTTAGADVIGTGRDAEALERSAELCAALPGTFTAVQLDVCDTAAVDHLFGSLDHLDICIANAGIAEQRALLETSADDVRRMLDVNTTGAFAVMRAAAATMLAQEGGRIVAIASDAALKGIPRMAGYVASKHALLGLTRTLALELEGTGVHVTTVCPSGIRTGILGASSLLGGMDVDEVAAVVLALANAGPSIGSCEIHLRGSE